MARALDFRQRSLSIAAAALVFLTLVASPVFGQSSVRRGGPAFPPHVNRAELLRRLANPKLDRAERARLITEAFARPVTMPDSPSPEPSIDATPVNGCGQWNAWFPDTSGSVARADHLMVYDPTGDRVVVFGGYDDRNEQSADVWTLNLAGSPTWTRLQVVGTPPDLFRGARGIYDGSRNRIVVYGQSLSANSSVVYQLTLSGTPTWSNVTPPGTLPTHDFGYTTIYDAPRDRMVVFGGFIFDQSGDVPTNDVWALSFAPGGQWTKLAPAGPAPSPRYFSTAIVDVPRDRMVVFGGYGYDDVLQQQITYDETWTLSLAGGTAWTKLSPGGAAAPALLSHTAVFDAPRNRMIVFAGIDPIQVVNDAWSLSLTGATSWSKLTPSGVTPVATSSHAAVYDPVRQRMLVFGGYEAGGDETWALSLTGSSTWSQIPTAGSVPRRRTGATLIVDTPRARAVMFGGATARTARSATCGPTRSRGLAAGRAFTPAAPIRCSIRMPRSTTR